MSERCVLTIGVFDGVHLGHRAILERAVSVAAARGVPVKVMAFDPHPSTVLKPGTEPPRLSTLEEKADLLLEAGAAQVIPLVPTPELLAMSPEEFLGKVVREQTPLVVVEGGNFRFGKKRAGDVAMLARLGAEMGFEAVVVEQVQAALSDQLVAPVSSSLVRWLVGLGRVADAAICLGRQYDLTARVVEGQKMGRTLGVPTANLDPEAVAGKLVPGDGVYAAMVDLPDGRAWPAAVSVGAKPTFQGQRLTVEAHLLGFSGDLYGRTIRLRFARWVRDQQAFPGVEPLRAQLGRDIEQTRRWHELNLLAAGTAAAR